MNQQITLLRGCALFENRRARLPHSYILGTTNNVAAVTSAFERTALTQLAQGIDPLSRASAPIRAELEIFIHSLAQQHLAWWQHSDCFALKQYAHAGLL